MPLSVGSIGEYTEVASANRGVRGTLREESDEEVDVRGFKNSTGRLLSSCAA